MQTAATSLNVVSHMDIPSDLQLREMLPCSQKISSHVEQSRLSIQKILSGLDDRLLVVIGPCSIHDPVAAFEYAKKLAELANHYKNNLLIVMRSYFEKPRTTVGWKGFINDPWLDESFDGLQGLTQSRQLLLEINGLLLPTATEFLAPQNAPYIADLISWGAIGARTTESPIHRELASALPCAIGFKNSTDGNITVALQAMLAAGSSHCIALAQSLRTTQLVKTIGNHYCHLVLRGGQQPNYFPSDIQSAVNLLKTQKLPTQLMIDCSHGNSQKQHKQQLQVAGSLCQQIAEGNYHIAAVMLESFLEEGCQQVAPLHKLTYGKSITDACINWRDTELVISQLDEAVNARRYLSQNNFRYSALLETS